MDAELGRLIEAFERRANGPAAIVLVGDHGEGLGDHGEVPARATCSISRRCACRSPWRARAWRRASPTRRSASAASSTRSRLGRRSGAADSLRGESTDVVLGEAMKPYLEYGWQPQIMAVQGRQKAIFAGATELYDVVADPGEARDLSGGADLPAAMRAGLDDYPVPSPEAARAPAALSAADRQTLASLGYVSATAAPVVRKDAPRPVDMVRLFGATRGGVHALRAGEIRAGHSAARTDSCPGPL